jgi:hypothetical protein
MPDEMELSQATSGIRHRVRLVHVLANVATKKRLKKTIAFIPLDRYSIQVFTVATLTTMFYVGPLTGI